MKVTRYFPEFRKENNKYSAFEMLKGVKGVIKLIVFFILYLNQFYITGCFKSAKV